MARIPIRDYQVGIPAAQIAPYQSVEQAGALGRQIGGSVSSIAGDVFDYQGQRNLVEAHLARLERDQTLQQDLAQFGLDAKNLSLDAVNSPEPEAHFAEGIRKLRDDWQQKYSANTEANRRASLVAEANASDVRSAAIRQREQAAVGRFGNTLDTLMRTGGMSGSDAERGNNIKQADDAIDQAVAAGIIRQDQGDAHKQKYRAGIDELTLRGIGERNPGAALSALRSGMFPGLAADERQTFSERYLRASEADARQRQADLDRQRAIEERDTADNDAWFVVDLERGLKAGSKELRDIEAARADGRLKPGQYDSLTATWDAVERTKLRQAEEDRRVADTIARVDSGVGLDPKSKDDRAAVDAWFARRAQGMQPDDLQGLIITTATRTGIIPPAVVGQLNSAARGSPERMAWAAGTFQTLDQQAPQVLDELPGDTTRSLRLMSQYTSAGYGPADAHRRVAADLQVTDQVKTEREKFVREGGDRSPAELAWADFRDSRARPDQSFWERGKQGLDDADLALPVKADYQRAYANAYRITGNNEASRAEAAADIAKRWWVTDVDGKRRWMQYAPEMVYGGRDRASAEWLGQQLVDQAAQASGLPADKVRGTLSLVADPLTTRAASAGLPPTYGVFRVDPATGLIGELRHADGSAFRFQPTPRDMAVERAADVQKMQDERTRRMDPASYAPGAGMAHP